MICLDCTTEDIRYDENEKTYYCNNCGGRHIAWGICKNLKENNTCVIGASSTGSCKYPCSYFEREKL